jgi:Ca2+/H+ antiporter, TMEM165/GDT1 family
VAFALTALGAALAVALELFEALAIVLAVALSRRPREAILGAVAAAAACVALGVVLGPVLIAQVAGSPLKLVVGVALLLFGLEWLRKGVLRLAHLRSPSSSFREFVEEQEELESLELPPPGKPDWAGRTIAFKGVLLEGIEVILILTALGARPGGLAPALIGGGVALVAVVGVGLVLHAPLARLPETHLKYVVGLVLSTFGVFFAAEGLGVAWPLSDAALLYIAAAFLIISQIQIRVLSHEREAVAA